MMRSTFHLLKRWTAYAGIIKHLVSLILEGRFDAHFVNEEDYQLPFIGSKHKSLFTKFAHPRRYCMPINLTALLHRVSDYERKDCAVAKLSGRKNA